jgi:uncharacterized Ntn-hydrolase superfamily protein
MRTFFAILFVLSLSLGASAQHTFSMVAVDTTTGVLGAAGATCLSFYPMGAQLNRIVPGKGVVNTQAWLSPENRDLAAKLLQQGLSAQEILDSLYAADEYPEDRQNLVIDLNGSGVRTAGFTGDYCMSYANHIVGPNYVIAGNILAGQKVLDSMENAFKRTKGSLADKLMAALLAAKFPGADSRCHNTSSLSAFIRVAGPGDSIEHYFMDLNVQSPETNEFEPIDTLYKRFLAFKASGMRNMETPRPQILLYPNPAKNSVSLKISGLRKSGLSDIAIEDLNGRKIKDCHSGIFQDKDFSITIPVESLKPGVYVVNVGGLRQRFIKL